MSKFLAKTKYISHSKTNTMDFEFNKPILKKQGAILKYFEKNSTDFEEF